MTLCISLRKHRWVTRHVKSISRDNYDLLFDQAHNPSLSEFRPTFFGSAYLRKLIFVEVTPACLQMLLLNAGPYLHLHHITITRAEVGQARGAWNQTLGDDNGMTAYEGYYALKLALGYF